MANTVKPLRGVATARRSVALPIVALAIWMPEPAPAQVVGMERVVTRDGVRLDFAPDGVWRAKARRVASVRARLRTPARFDALNAQIRQAAVNGSGTLSGTLYIPTVLFAFSDTEIPLLPAASNYDAIFYSTVPLPGRPYTVRTLYEEISNNQLTVDGQTFGWTPVSNPSSFYLTACGASSNPLDCATGRNRFGGAFRDAVAAIDGTVDFGQFDNDGIDDVPNSGDDDGVVDVIQFVQPVQGGECGGPGIWAHKFSLDQVGGAYATDDAASGGGFVTINSYLVVSGIGGTNCQTLTEIMSVGVSAHELGHGLGLPDLYDTGGGTEGIGEWGLMGSGIYTSLPSPAHYSAWSKEQLGWVTVRELTTTGTYSFGPVVSSDTVFMIRAQGANPRGEYFLIENKQPIGADTANMLSGGKAGPKNGGLLIWHIDETKVAQSSLPNTVNFGAIHGVALIEADGANDLINKTNRGDAGDPFPGNRGNTKLSFSTVPSAEKNSDGDFVGFQIDAITQVVPNGEMSFQALFGVPTVVRASDDRAKISVDGVEYTRFADLLEPSRAYEISVADIQTTPGGRSEFRFGSWSDGGARTHTFSDPAPGDSIIAFVNARHLVRATTQGQGTVSSVEAPDLLGGTLVDDDLTVTLVAEPAAGLLLDSWSGDTAAAGDTLRLPMRRPFDVIAIFQPPVALLGDLKPVLMGARYADTLRATGGGGVGTYSFELLSGRLPDGVVLRNLINIVEIAGVPLETGEFPLVLEAASGNLTDRREFQLSVTEPQLQVDELVAQLIGQGVSLTQDEVRYLDLLGNHNDVFDVGDFLAWVDASGVEPAMALARLEGARAKPGSPAAPGRPENRP